MQLIRKYKKLLWFDLLDYIDQEISTNPNKNVYIEIMDEFRIRLLESVSEGASFKLKAPAQNLFDKFVERSKNESGFANDQDVEELKQILNDIL